MDAVRAARAEPCDRAFPSTFRPRTAPRRSFGKPGRFLVHYNGATWSPSAQSGQVTQSNLLAVASSASNDVWAVGERGTVLHMQSGTWAVSDSGSTLELRAIGPRINDEVTLAGQAGTILVALPPVTAK